MWNNKAIGEAMEIKLDNYLIRLEERQKESLH